MSTRPEKISRDEAAAIITRAVSRADKALSEHDAKQVIAAYGVPIAAERLCVSASEAVEAAKALGYPVVAKGCGPTLQHKTELDMIRLNLGSDAAVASACAELQPRLPPGAGLLVQKMLSGKRELMAGVIRDPQFGPCVSLGIGGVFAEVLADATFRAAPFGPEVARSMIEDLKMASILGAFRGQSPVDQTALAQILVGLGDLAIAHPEIAEVDVNPLLVVGADPIAVDALIVFRA